MTGVSGASKIRTACILIISVSCFVHDLFHEICDWIGHKGKHRGISTLTEAILRLYCFTSTTVYAYVKFHRYVTFILLEMLVNSRG